MRKHKRQCPLIIHHSE